MTTEIEQFLFKNGLMFSFTEDQSIVFRKILTLMGEQFKIKHSEQTDPQGDIIMNHFDVSFVDDNFATAYLMLSTLVTVKINGYEETKKMIDQFIVDK